MVLDHLGHATGGLPAAPVPSVYGSLQLTAEQVRLLLQGGAAPKATLYTRKNEASLTKAEQDAFKAAVVALKQNGIFDKFVELHRTNYAHHMLMLPSLPYSGAMRFLGWHRVFLLRFEEALRKVDPAVTVPYWEWTRRRGIPPWLDGWPDWTRRATQAPELLPPREDIWTRLRSKPYALFTLLLEGWTPQVSTDPRSIRPLDSAHNRVHVWVGGDMRSPNTAPNDPIFWLHHAEVDRLWHIWQLANPGDHPVFVPPSDAVMSPWGETYAEIADIRALGYRYEEETFPLGMAGL